MARKPLKLAKPMKAPKSVKPVKAPARKPKSRFADGGEVTTTNLQPTPKSFANMGELSAAASRIKAGEAPESQVYQALMERRAMGPVRYSELTPEESAFVNQQSGRMLHSLGLGGYDPYVTNARLAEYQRQREADPNYAAMMEASRQETARRQQRPAQQQQPQRPRVAIPQQQVRATPSFVQQQNAALQAALARRPQTFGIGMGGPRQPPMNMRPQPQMPQQAGPMQQGQPGGIGAMGMPGSFFKKGGKVSAKKPAAKSKRK